MILLSKPCIIALLPLLLSILLLGGSCVQPTATETTDGDETAALITSTPQEIPFETVAAGSSSGIEEPTERIITTTEEWEALWKEIHASLSEPPSVPEINFEEQMVLAVFQGTQSTGGYKIEITRVEESGSVIRVLVEETKPAPDAIVIQVLTSPFHIVKVKHTDKPVEFALGYL